MIQPIREKQQMRIIKKVVDGVEIETTPDIPTPTPEPAKDSHGKIILWEDRLPKESKANYIKRKTQELYDCLPNGEYSAAQEEARKSRYDIRDAVYELNQAFFGYIVQRTFLNCNYAEYSDKYNSAVCSWMNQWHKWRWVPRFRADLAFGVFFLLRVGENLEREFNEVKYSVRRDLYMKVASQIGCHWGQVKYEDLARPEVELSGADRSAIQASFGTLYYADIEEQLLFLEAPEYRPSTLEQLELSDNYNDIHTLIMRELIDLERQFKPSDFRRLSDMYSISEEELKAAYPKALEQLYALLKTNEDSTM